ncbi:hypothetical protein IHE44_0003989 [Lamprotornis superbus]|uniref:Nedd4 family interacting protein 1 n=1 Tax=Lamprotornis superbus TaxID=245042 RepID=A0A835TZ55_9PASS|nr:hypothetical protein IHE44_0003989 [Lamprotornis superbus]
MGASLWWQLLLSLLSALGLSKAAENVPEEQSELQLTWNWSAGLVLCCFAARGLADSAPHFVLNEEEPGEAVPVVNDAPPPYSSISAESTAYFDYKDESGFPKPPSYNVATTLPSYDEAERTKAEATIPLVPGRDEDFVTRDDFDDTDQLRIGNDGIFMLTFFMAFLFNWIGFFLSFCLTTSAAGRYGAISGFGLSLIKWILIVRFSTYFPGYFDGQYWLWWVFLVLGVKF